METNSPAQPYLLLFRNTGPENYRRLSAAERQRLVSRWNDWYEKLVTAGQATEGQPLEEATRIISGPGGQRIVDGPFPEAKEAIGGYVKLQAANLEEATAIAQQHPGMAYGMAIEVRPLTQHCHLGVTAHHLTQTAAAV